MKLPSTTTSSWAIASITSSPPSRLKFLGPGAARSGEDDIYLHHNLTTSHISRGFYGDIKADERCYVRNESNNLSQCDYKNSSNLCETAAAQYFRKVVQGLDKAPLSTEVVDDKETTFALSDLGNIGEIKWDIALCLLLSWTVVCLCLIKGIKSSGKVVYFSATFPYLLLITLMIYGLFQDGAIDGVKKLFVPSEDDLQKILNIQVGLNIILL